MTDETTNPMHPKPCSNPRCSLGYAHSMPCLTGGKATNTAPTAPADDLPPGYFTWDGQTWAAPGARMALGWERENDGASWPAWIKCWTKVRPVTSAEPATEWVPWWEAQGRLLGGLFVAAVGLDGIGPFVRYQDARCDRSPIRADGKVEVQR